MGEQAAVQSIDDLKEFRVALAAFTEDVETALGGVDMEIRRAMQWVQYERRAFWLEQIKKRREKVAAAQAEVFRRKLSKTGDSSPAMTEQKEALRKAEMSLKDAEFRAGLIKKYEVALQQAAFDYHATTRRIINLASGDIPRAIITLGKIVDALEAYLRESPPELAREPAPIGSIAGKVLTAAEQEEIEEKPTEPSESETEIKPDSAAISPDSER